jgi:hypothetical protein
MRSTSSPCWGKNRVIVSGIEARVLRESEMTSCSGPGRGWVLSLKKARSLSSTASRSSFLGLIGVEDRESPAEADRFAVHAQGPVPDAMEGPAPEPVGLDARQILHPVQHLLGGLVGEGEQEDLAGAHPLGKQPGDPVGEGAGLPGTGPGQHEERPRRGSHGRELLIVELGPKIDRRNGLREPLIF